MTGYNETAKQLTKRYTKEAVGSGKVNPNKVPPVQESLKKIPGLKR